MTGVNDVAKVAYKQAVEKYEAAKMKLLGLTLQVRSCQAAMDVEANKLLLSPDFAPKGGLYTNKEMREAALAEKLAPQKKAIDDLETQIITATYEVDVASKWESFFRHTYERTE